MIFTEEYNKENIISLLNLDRNILLDFLHVDEVNKDGEKWNPKYLMSYLKKILSLGAEIQNVEYSKKDNSRIYTDIPSAQRFPTHIRNLIVKDTYKDYDMENAHFNILYKLCLQNNIERTDFLKNYCLKRNEILKSYNLNKYELLKILNQDNPKKKNNQFLNHFIPEIQRIKKELFDKLYDGSELKKRNPTSSYLNKYHFTKIENELLQKVIKHFNIQFGVPMFDGIMTPLQLDLEKCQELTGMVWVEKSREPLRRIPENIDYSGDQIDYAKLYYEHYGDDWIVNKEMGRVKLYHFNKHNNLWYEVDKPYNELYAHIKEDLLPIVCNHEFITQNAGKNVEDITKKMKDLINSSNCSKNIGEQFINYLIYLWRENVEFDNIPHIIHFKNKSWDFKKMDWISRERDHFATITAPELQEIDDEDFSYITNTIESILPDKDCRDTYLNILSTCCMGKTLEKVVFANGTGGNGKGVINGCLMKGMLGDYYYTGDNNILLCKQSGANQSIASMKNKRMVVMEEPDEKRDINFCMVKMITGGDAVNARALYDKNCITSLVLSLIIECNKKPRINGDTGDSMFRRLLDVLFPRAFKDKDGADRYKGDGYFDSDPNIKEKLKPIATQFFYYIIEWMEDNDRTYDNIWDIKVSDKIKKRSKEYIESNNPVKELIEQVARKIEVIKDKDNVPMIKFNEVVKKIKETEFWKNQTNAFKRTHGKNNLIKILEKDPQMSKSMEKDTSNVWYIKGWEFLPDEDVDEAVDDTPVCVKPSPPLGEPLVWTSDEED